jgi:hypothetical protein
MFRLALNVVLSVAVIVGATWLAKRHAATAGFVAALPITTMMVLALGRFDGVSIGEQATFARSLLAGIPLGATFLLPFVFAPRAGLGFGSAFAAGLVLLALAYGVHRWIFGA